MMNYIRVINIRCLRTIMNEFLIIICNKSIFLSILQCLLNRYVSLVREYVRNILRN